MLIDLQNWIHFFAGHPVFETLVSLRYFNCNYASSCNYIFGIRSCNIFHTKILIARQLMIIFLFENWAWLQVSYINRIGYVIKK